MIILYASRLTYMYNILQRFEMMAILTNDYPSKQRNSCVLYILRNAYDLWVIKNIELLF